MQYGFQAVSKYTTSRYQSKPEGSPRIFYLSKSTILIERLDIRDRTSLNS
jgi:hypothetical protein